MKLDQIDKKIIDLLTKDGRMSCAEIARDIGNISERSVRYRLERLIEENVVQITAVPVPPTLGYTVKANVFIEAEPGTVLRIAKTISQFEFVTYVACSTGEPDITVDVVARDNQEIYSFVTELLGTIPGVRKTTTSMVAFVIKDIDDWRIPPDNFKETENGG